MYNMDLTGVAPDFLRSNDIFVLSKTGMKINFNQPIFKDSLVMMTTDGLSLNLTAGVDWSVSDDDVDETATARAQTKDITFAKTLIKSVTIIRPQAQLPVKVAMTYQQLFSMSPVSPLIASSADVQFDPTSWSDSLRRLAALEQLAARVSNDQANTSAVPKLLKYDPTGSSPDNLIVNEQYQIDTYSGIRNIQLVNGSFYRDSVKITTPDGLPFSEGTQYNPQLFNKAKTNGSSNNSGVYDLLQIVYDYSGPVNITYRAVGGAPTIADMVSVYARIQSIYDFLNSTSILSSDMLGDTDVIKNIITRITENEEVMRKLASGTPTYGDATNGISVVKYFNARDTDKLHWFPVARLYKVEGSQSLITSDTFRMRMKLVRSGILADVVVAFDADNPIKQIQVDSFAVQSNPSFSPYGNSVSTPIVYPQFRVAWNNNGGVLSGAVLQIGLNLPTGVETAEFFDLSGNEGCWILDQTVSVQATPINPTDDVFLLPDGESTWSSTGTESKVATAMMPVPTGYLIYEGTRLLSTFDSTAGSAWTVTTHVLPAFFRIEDIKSIMVDVFDPTGPTGFRVEVPMSSFASGKSYGKAPYIVNTAMMNLVISLAQDSSTGQIVVKVSLDSALPQNTTAVIRYMTAKV